MNIIGIDFTSAPTQRKPIVCCRGTLSAATLHIEGLEHWHTFAPFEQLLAAPGSWLGAMDFPFGQPRILIEQLGWPDNWNRYVRQVGSHTKADFVELLQSYCDSQPAGQKHLRRATDTAAGACSPMMIYGVPVGKMFYEGAPRLQASPVCVLPCRPSESTKIAIEGYPALVARQMLGKTRYKGNRCQSLRKARQQLVAQMAADVSLPVYDVRVQLPPPIAKQLIDDDTGDDLDAVLCAVQAATAGRAKHRNHGIPADVDALEGWIVDPNCNLQVCDD